MNIHAELRVPQTRTQRLKLLGHFFENGHEFGELMNIFLSENYRLQQHSAWVVCNIARRKPSLLHPYNQQLINKLNESHVSSTFKRNVVRAWQEIDLPEEHLGEIYDLCFSYITGKEAIAVKVFSMTICYNITNKFPELKPELLVAIEDILIKDGQKSNGILSRGGKTVQLLKKDLTDI